jgi:hypothetical protein
MLENSMWDASPWMMLTLSAQSMFGMRVMYVVLSCPGKVVDCDKKAVNAGN